MATGLMECPRLQLLFNPEGSAYRSETGGLMEALRVLKVEQSKYSHIQLNAQPLTLPC